MPPKKIEWGAFTKDAKKYGFISRVTGKPLLRSFSRRVISDSENYPPIVVKRARFYRNVILKKSLSSSKGGKRPKPKPRHRPPAPRPRPRAVPAAASRTGLKPLLMALGLKALDLYHQYGAEPDPESGLSNAIISETLYDTQ